MANPNIVGVTDIKGKTLPLAVTTSAQAIVSNASASNKVYKVNKIWFANIDGVNPASVTLNYYTAAALGGTATALISAVVVPALSTLIFDGPMYLEEDKSLGVLASASGDIVATATWEEITS